MAYHNTIRTQSMQCHSLLLRYQSGCFTIETSGMSLRRSYIKILQHMHSNLKMWRERTKKHFRGLDVPHDMYCSATTVLKFDSVWNKGKNYHLQVSIWKPAVQHVKWFRWWWWMFWGVDRRYKQVCLIFNILQFEKTIFCNFDKGYKK